jgi:hypothetical protein
VLLQYYFGLPKRLKTGHPQKFVREFKLDVEALSEFADVEDISAQTIDLDYERSPKIHRCWKITRF